MAFWPGTFINVNDNDDKRFTVVSRMVTFPDGFFPERRFPESRFPDSHFPG